jgi:hypothetical protein
VSLAVGLVLSIPDLVAQSSSIPITIQRILRSGQPLLIVGILPSATAFIVSWLVTDLAGAETLGHVEGARIVGQPVTVLMVGLGAVLGPRITRAAGARDQATAERVGRQFERMILASGVLWALVVAAPAPINPLTAFVPVAYAVPGLVVGSIAAYTIMSLAQGRRYAMFGGGLERLVARSELEGNVARMLVALTVGAIGAWAVPIGIACLGVVRWVRATRWLVDYYAGRLVAPGRPTDDSHRAPATAAAAAAEERPG